MPDTRPATLTWIAFAASLVVLAGSLWLSIGMDLKACPLCFYQRTFVMGVVALFAIGFFARIEPRALLSVLALPMIVAALAVAGYHVWLELSGTLECPKGILGLGTAPQQSFVGLTIIIVALLTDVIRNRSALRSAAGMILAGMIIGVVLAYAAIISSPPPPAPPAAPYEDEPTICRPPYQPE